MRGLSQWKAMHVLSTNAVLVHFRSCAAVQGIDGHVSEGVAEHVAGARPRDVHVHGDVSQHALATGNVRLRFCGGCWRLQKLVLNCCCGHYFDPCSERLARAIRHFAPRHYMQMSLSDLHASALSILSDVKLLGVSGADVWKEGAAKSYIGRAIWSGSFRAGF